MAYNTTTSRDWYSYLSDDTTHYVVATTDANAAAQTAPPSPIAPGSLPAFPRGFKMRFVMGAILDGSILRRTKLPIFLPTDAIFVGGSSTFSKSGLTGWVIEGRIGERRTYKGG